MDVAVGVVSEVGISISRSRCLTSVLFGVEELFCGEEVICFFEEILYLREGEVLKSSNVVELRVEEEVGEGVFRIGKGGGEVVEL